jgi:hypothetical protein
MKAPLVGFHSRAAIALGLLVSFSSLGHSETVNVSRRLVRFDGKPAAGAKVRVLSDYGTRDKKTDFEVIAGADGIFSADVTQENALWVGHLIVKAEGCATTCEVAVTARRKNEPWTPVLGIGRPFRIEGKTIDAEGRPVAQAKVSLIWARPKQWNPTVFNSMTTDATTTPELIAHSATNGTWSMMGIDFVTDGRPISASAVFEAATDKPTQASMLDLQLDPEPRAESRKNISLDFRLAPLIRVAGRVVNSVTGDPVAGAGLQRNILFTSLASSSARTDKAGRFELHIAGPLHLLWFWVYRDGFATTTVKTAMRKQATSDWADTNDLLIRVRPIVAVSGRLRDENGKPPDEPLELHASYEERIDAVWNQECTSAATESKVGPDGSFNAKLPAGRITIGLCRPPQQMGSVVMVGMAPTHFRLREEVEIPAEGMKGLQLNATRTKETK